MAEPRGSHLSIGEVLGLLLEEFPDVTISKIRFLESQGLLDPERTPSGYRKFYEGDIERLRWILRHQRDHFLPLKVMKDRLEEAAANGQVVPPDEPLVTAGRHPDSVIFLDDITVSRRHAEVRQVDGGYEVKDVGSLNGTYLNRERVETASLSDGDELQIGTFKLLFLAGRP